ncbi:MAG: SCP2 sterol-binding domain-containing protein [Betaproteobacteria bacterium]|nr:SCP2 sterol-binding domain-containing protein [Betaproteobacteria bacterium]
MVVEDAGVELLFRVRGRRFVPVAKAEEPVLRFRAVAWDYAALAAREADPDTLFFNRRLVVEGDTEIALLVKNTLDTIDIPRTRGSISSRAMRAVGAARKPRRSRPTIAARLLGALQAPARGRSSASPAISRSRSSTP